MLGLFLLVLVLNDSVDEFLEYRTHQHCDDDDEVCDEYERLEQEPLELEIEVSEHHMIYLEPHYIMLLVEVEADSI